MLQSRQSRSRMTVLAVLVGAFCALSLSPAALAAHDKGRENAGDHRQAKPQARQVETKARRARSKARQAESKARLAKPEGRRSQPDQRRGESQRARERPTCIVPSGAGILRVGGCAVQVGNNHKFKKIAKAFKDAGYYAYVRNDNGNVSVRVYGFPAFDWDAGSFTVHTTRRGNVLEIRLCRIGR